MFDQEEFLTQLYERGVDTIITPRNGRYEVELDYNGRTISAIERTVEECFPVTIWHY